MTSGDPHPESDTRVGVNRQIGIIRKRMDELDAKLVALLNARANCAREIGYLKDTVGMEVYQPNRESEVLSRVRAQNTGPLDGDAMTRVFERIIEEARRLERSPESESDPDV